MRLITNYINKKTYDSDIALFMVNNVGDNHPGTDLVEISIITTKTFRNWSKANDETNKMHGIIKHANTQNHTKVYDE